MFIEWFVVGLGFVIAMLISQGVAMGGLTLLSGESPPVWIARAITMPAGALQFYALFLVAALIACILFALIFKRRSVIAVLRRNRRPAGSSSESRPNATAATHAHKPC